LGTLGIGYVKTRVESQRLKSIFTHLSVVGLRTKDVRMGGAL